MLDQKAWLSIILPWEAEKLKVKDSNNCLFAKAAGTLLRPGMHPRTEGEEKFCYVVVKTSDPHETKGVSTHHQRISTTNSLFYI